MNLKAFAAVFLTLSVMSAMAWAAGTQVKADQGAPGNQGAWPVTCVSGCGSGGSSGSGGNVLIDGGLVAVAPVKCAATQPDAGAVQRVTSVGTSAVNVPATGANTATRYYVDVCNSSENTGTPLVKCLLNGVSPVMGITNPGDVLGVSDCWRYSVPGTDQITCISDTASTAVTSSECVPTP